ncbi:MAG: ornithine decarboxylase [Gammaproteobacteria bacterium]|jgi:ornithine decarboxylase
MNQMTQPLNKAFQPYRYADAAQYIELNPLSEPAYLFSDAALTARVGEFQQHFKGELSYAVKANPEPLLLDCLWNAGVNSFDVASVGEIALISNRFEGAQCHYNNPVRSDEMTNIAAYQYGVRSFAVDDEAGLSQLAALGLSNVEASIRFKLDHFDAAYDFGSKFGADVVQATQLLQRAERLGMRCSLTFHPGSQCTDPAMYEKHIEAAAKIKNDSGVVLCRLNVGGGFPLPYENTQIGVLTDYMSVIHTAVAVHFGDEAPALLCEPGRALVGSCTSLLTQVIRVRENGAVFINDGIYGGLQEQMMVRLDLPYRVWREGKVVNMSAMGAHSLADATVFGPTCDPIDRLPNKLAFPVDIQAGDFIEFGLIGAYGSATATGFNSFASERYVEVQSGYFELAH